MSSQGCCNCPITVDQIELSLIIRSVSRYSGLTDYIYLFKWSVLRLVKPNVIVEKEKKKWGEGKRRQEDRIILHALK